MVTATGTCRSRVVQTVAPGMFDWYQQTPVSVHTSSVAAATLAGAAPHCTVIGGSPKAAFCSGPAVTCRWSRPCHWPLSPSWAMKARHIWACAGDRLAIGTATGAVEPGDGAADVR